MAINPPLYGPGDTAYFKESAAIGVLEAVRISGAHLGQNGWVYSVNATMSPPSVGGYQERRSQISTQIIYYTEDEFLSLCDAMLLVEANAKLAYDRAKNMRQLHCPDPTE